VLRLVLAGAAPEGRDDARLPVLGIAALAFTLRLGLWVAFQARALASLRRSIPFWLGAYPEFIAYPENLVHGEGYHFQSPLFGDFWTMRPPLYSLLLASLLRLCGSADLPPVLVQALIGALSAALAFAIARRLFGRQAGLAAGVLVAVYPYYIAHDVVRQEIVLFAFLNAAAILLLLRAQAGSMARDAFGAGAVLGLAALTRQTLLAFIPLAALWLGAFTARRRARGVLLLLAGVMVVVTPWMVRNALIVGRPVFTTSTGIGLWWSHTPGLLNHYPREFVDRAALEYWDSYPPEVRTRVVAMPETERDRWWREQAWAYIRTHPREEVRGAAVKAVVALGLVKSPSSGYPTDLLYLAIYVPLLLAAGLGAWTERARWRETLLFFLLFLSYFAPAVMTWSHTNHRIFLDLYLMVLASVPLSRLCGRVVGWAGRDRTR
jgi:4-amino-4-deoxy-L-arabinose transferase-like glycosyltransferase